MFSSPIGEKRLKIITIQFSNDTKMFSSPIGEKRLKILSLESRQIQRLPRHFAAEIDFWDFLYAFQSFSAAETLYL